MGQRSSSSAPPAPSASDGDLIGAAVGGDRHAAERLMASLAPRVGNLVRYLVRGDRESDDISQEALVAILRGLSGFRAQGTLQSWADRVVIRATFAFIRRRRSEPASSGAPLHEIEAQDVGAASPDANLTDHRAAALLARLPSHQREVMFLHHVLEMSIPEIAMHLSAPIETIRSRLKRGLTRLRNTEPGVD